jgi:hypothetical protein
MTLAKLAKMAISKFRKGLDDQGVKGNLWPLSLYKYPSIRLTTADVDRVRHTDAR